MKRRIRNAWQDWKKVIAYGRDSSLPRPVLSTDKKHK